MKAGRRITRKQLMTVLDEVFEQGGYKLTVRSYNAILTGLGFRLGEYGKPKSAAGCTIEGKKT